MTELYHAYLITGDQETARVRLKQEFALPESGPDVWYQQFDSFGVDDSRQLIEQQSRRAFDGGKKYFVLVINSITVEAQNALLKTLEEPTPDTHIFLIVPQAEILLPTLCSRCQLLQFKDGGEGALEDAAKFLKLDQAGRLKLAEKIAKSDTARIEAQRLINQLEQRWHQEGGQKDPIDYEKVMTRLGQLRSYLADRSPAIRLILEELALLLP